MYSTGSFEDRKVWKFLHSLSRFSWSGKQSDKCFTNALQKQDSCAWFTWLLLHYSINPKFPNPVEIAGEILQINGIQKQFDLSIIYSLFSVITIAIKHVAKHLFIFSDHTHLETRTQQYRKLKPCIALQENKLCRRTVQLHVHAHFSRNTHWPHLFNVVSYPDYVVYRIYVLR